MKTDHLISALAADADRPALRSGRMWALALGLGAVIAALVFAMTIGPRPDFAQAIQTVRFDFKFVLTLTLGITAFVALRHSSRPGERVPAWLIFTAPVLGLIGVGLELYVLPQSGWAMAMVGKNAMVCLTYIPLIGIGPLVLLMLAVRRMAPTRPTLTGFMTGLVAGGVAATFYAAHCPDDSPLFVMVWYPLAIGGLAIAGAAIGKFALRW